VGIRLDVDIAPPDVTGGAWLFDDALVARTAAGLLARHGNHRSRAGDGGALFVTQRQLVEPRGRGVADNVGHGDAVASEVKMVWHGPILVRLRWRLAAIVEIPAR